MKKIRILAGTTASGKTALALEWAQKSRQQGTPLEIINADSLLVYRHFDIGTAKPSKEELASTPHHLIDIREPDETFTAADFVREVEKLLPEIHARGAQTLIVGGTAFYLKALLYGMWEAPPASQEFRATQEPRSSQELFNELEKIDSAAAHKITPGDRYRLVRALEIFHLSGKRPSELHAQESQEADPRFELWILDRETKELEARIRKRAQAMLDQGWIEETHRLRSQYPRARALQAVGYRQILNYLDQIIPPGRKVQPGEAGLLDEICLATRQLVKAQRTFYKGLQKRSPESILPAPTQLDS